MNEEYTDDQIEEWTREDLLNAPLLSDEEIQELRTNKRQLTAYAKQKLRKMKAQQQTQELLNAAHRIADGGVPLGKLIREGHDDPMTTRVRYEYAALLRELINQCGYDNYHVDGDHGLLVVNVRDILGIIEVLEEMK
jgi:UDP-N-acetyl-D-mannosaminuronic acid transferase (WecB/TagA/CpsF family)